MTWPEMTDLHTTAELVEVVFLGAFNSEMSGWIKNAGLTAKIVVGNKFASVFIREHVQTAGTLHDPA